MANKETIQSLLGRTKKYHGGILAMVRRIFVTLFCSVYLIIFVSALHGEDSKKITLPNNEVVWDLNGEWDAWVENYGSSAYRGSYPQIIKITQTGSSFVAIRMIDDVANQKGSKIFQGELDKNGIKQVTNHFGHGAGGFLESKGQISDDGNRITIDNGIRSKFTLTRK